MVQTDKSATLSTLQDQTLFQPLDVDCRNGTLNEMATPLQERMSSSLNAEGVVACMATQQGGAEIRTDDKSPTLASGQRDASVVIAIENHPNDSRIKLSKDNVIQTLSKRMGTGGAIHR